MALDRLWAGWRSEYMETATSMETGPRRCVFCTILASGEPDEDTHVLWRDPGGRAVAVLNAFPYGSGHLMVMPARHVATPEDLDADESTAIWTGVTAAIRAVRSAYRPDGVNIGANLGKAAGAGVPGHFHMHVLPRWNGDTNFMTSVAECRVLPEPLRASAQKLRASWPPD